MDDLVKAFWHRYHLRFAPSVEPSDLLIPRLNKEIEKRLLTVQNIWQTRTMTHQLRTDRKRQKITATIDLVEKETEADVMVHKTLATYLDMLHTLCIAYARAGIKAVKANAPETPTSEPTDYITAPLDLMLRYHHRAQVKVQLLPPNEALPWLQTRDEEERTQWVERYRGSDFMIGQVVKEVYQRREAVWDVPAPAPRAPKPRDTGVASDPNSPKAAREVKGICYKFNAGTCKEPCPANRLHACSQLLRNGKPCGMRNHGAKDCRNTKKATAP